MAIGFVTFGRVRTLTILPSGQINLADHGETTIVIPARNEATSLPHLLEDLARHRPANSRVIVVDDHSTDDTASLASAHAFATVVAAPELPAGWTGKSWACHIGSRDVPAGELIFLDADVRIEAGALDSAIAERRKHGGVVSVQPHHVVPTWSEQLSGLFNVVAIMGSGAGGHRPNGIFGPVICCDVDDYRSIGGHGSVRSEVVEDIALGHRFQRFGAPVRVFRGGSVIRFRMYPDGWRTMVEGWTKNMATGATRTPWLRALGTFSFVCGLVVASIMTLQTASAAVGPGAVSWNTAVGSVVGMLTLAVLLGRVGTFRVTSWLAMPALTCFFVAIIARSGWLTLVRRKVTWRGRAIPIGPPAFTLSPTHRNR